MLRRRTSVFTLVVLVAVISFISCKGREPSQREVPSAGAALPGVEAAVQANLALLRSEDPADRWAAAFRLERMGPMARSAVPALVGALSDQHTPVRKAAITALGEMGPDARSTVPELRRLLEDSDATVRLRAESALRRIEHDDRVRDAIERLGHPDAAVRLDAVLDLEREAPDAPEAVPALIAALKEESPTIRLIAVRTLGRIASLKLSSALAVFEAIEQYKDDPDESIREEVATVRGVLGLFLMGVDQFNQGDIDGSIEQFAIVLRHAPDHVAAYHNLGIAYLMKSSYDTAVAFFDKAIELEPRGALAFWSRGRAFAEKGSTEEAFTDYNRALFLDPSLGGVYLARALAYKGRKEYDLAVQDLNTFLTLTQDPGELQEGHLHRAYIYFVTGNYSRSLEDANRALEIAPPNAAAYFYKAVACDSLGQEREAAEAYRSFAETPLGPSDVDLRDSWLRIRARFGYPPETHDK
jgi:tetratricopeptide (TPR) repeat protein